MPLFAGESREQLRRRYLDAWRKFSAREPLEPLEAQLAAVIAEHPEYVGWLESGEAALLGRSSRPKAAARTPSCTWGCTWRSASRSATDRPRGHRRVHRATSPRAQAARTPPSTA